MAHSIYQITQYDLAGVEILRELGHSEHHSVYLVERDKKQYALKVPLLTTVTTEKRLLYFRREGAAMALIHHPALANVIELGQTSVGPYILIEYIQGKTLRAILDRTVLDQGYAIDTGIVLASALGAMHRQGIVHRDLQPDNIMIDEQNQLRVIDFGIIENTHLVSQSINALHYRSPEQTGIIKRPVDGRSDLYSLGVVLYECLIGSPPLTANNASELMRMHAVSTPTSLTKLHPTVSPSLNAIILKLLAKDPDDRYQTAEGVVSDLINVAEFDYAFMQSEPVQLGRDDHRTAALYETAIVGREYELAILRDAWNIAKRSEGGLVIINGSSGSGKSHLAREILHRAASEGGLVLETRCVKDGVIPFCVIRSFIRQYLAFIEMMPIEQHRQIIEDIRAALIPIGKRLLHIMPEILSSIHITEHDLAVYIHDQSVVYDYFINMLRQILRVYPGSIWLIDDVHYIDESSFTIIRTLLEYLAHEPVLLVIVIGTEKPVLIRDRFIIDRPLHQYSITLEPLNSDQSRKLISVCLGSFEVEDRVVQEIRLRSGGSPFAIREYVQTILDAGLLRLINGIWSIAPSDYTKLQLPPQIVPLLLRRIDELPSSTRTLLQAAALIGFEFSHTDLNMVCDGAVNEVNTALTIALKQHILERSQAGMYRFVHERLQTSLLSRLDETGLRNLHLHIAKVFDTNQYHDIERLYRIARHYALARSHRHYYRTYEVNLAAGMLALAHTAYDEAYTFFVQVYDLAPLVVQSVDTEVEAAFAEACFRTGRADQALVHFEEAVKSAKDPILRASIRIQRLEILAWLNLIEMDDADIQLAFAELGVKYHWNAFKHAQDIVGSIITYVARVMTPFKSSGVREHDLILVRLYTLIAKLSYLRGYRLGMTAGIIQALNIAKYLGPSSTLAETYALSSLIMGLIGLDTVGDSHIDKALSIAYQVDSADLTPIRLYQGMYLNLQGQYKQAEYLLQPLLVNEINRSHMVVYVEASMDLIWNYWLRGHIYDAWQLTSRVIEELSESAHQTGFPIFVFLPLSAAALLVTLGNPTEAEIHVRQLHVLRDTASQDMVRQVIVAISELALLLEQGETGSAMEAILHLGSEVCFVNTARKVFHLYHWFVLQAYARLAQVSQARGGVRRRAIKRFRKAIKDIKQVSQQPIIRAHALVLQGAEYRLLHNVAKALEWYAKAETIAYQIDSPWVQMQVAYERALILQAQGYTARAHTEALTAWQVASAHGWVLRTQMIYAKFDLHKEPLMYESRSDMHYSDSEVLRLQRQLDVLLKVVLSWTSVGNPVQQAQVALDVIVRILGAERAALFLYEYDNLVFRAGRDASGNDLSASDRWSLSLIERVRVTRQPVIVRSHDDEQFANLEQAEQLHVRSVLTAPLIFEDRLLGVLYLDNRLIWGVFSEADMDVLLAIANHVALGLETARTAQLEISIESERRQRLLAEQLRQVSTTLNSSLEFDVVLNQSLQVLQQLISYEQAAILLLEDMNQYARFVAVYGFSHPEMMRQMLVDVHEDDVLQSLIVLRNAILVCELSYVEQASSVFVQRKAICLGLPLIVRDVLIGFVILRQFEQPTFNEHDAELGMIFASQAAIALDNARLFGEVQRLAITDGLTQVWNRRHFFVLGEREWQRTLRYDHPLSALMIDVDHFKAINDTYGHAAGDLVLQCLVSICQSELRARDELGRYGGEEFAVLLPDTELSAAYDTAERLRVAIDSTPIHYEEMVISISVSIGVASRTADMPSVAALFDRADRGLYFAKEMGRNRVMMA